MRLVVLGGGFAGVWAALAADRMRRTITCRRMPLAITIVSREPWLTIKPRLYERNLADVRVPLDSIFATLRVAFVQGSATAIDVAARQVTIERASDTLSLRYDRLVLAAGSTMTRPAVSGIEHAFTVDTYGSAEALDCHIHSLRNIASPHADSVVVLGAGFTGLEVATEIASRLRTLEIGRERVTPRVVLVDRSDVVAKDLTSHARQHVHQALSSLGIEVRLRRTVRSIDLEGVLLSDGERIPAKTVIWTGGFEASTLTRTVPVELDDSGRVLVDEYLRVRGVPTIYAAGDVAHAMADASHIAPMSCQYAIPMGDTAGTNAVADLFDLSVTRFDPPSYVTCLDLGDAGALFTEGFGDDRKVRLTGFWAKRMKETINRRLILPPMRHLSSLAPRPRPRAA